MSSADLPGSSPLAGRYRLVEKLGAGGMSVVWRGFDEVLGRQVAIKVLPPAVSADPSFRRRLRAEAQAAARLSHPYITNVYDYGEALTASGAPVPFVVMELVDGESMAEILARLHQLPWQVVVRICAQVSAALAAAHARGIVHRDVTPSNVMLTPAGAKVVDFGISALIGENDIDPDGSLLGTPAYLAPERLEGGQVSPASDVYAVGLLIYRALIGQLPWDVGTTTALLRAHQYTEPEPLPPVDGMPRAVNLLVGRCLAKPAAARPTSAELATVLGRIAAAGPVGDEGHWADDGADTTILPLRAVAAPSAVGGPTPHPEASRRPHSATGGRRPGPAGPHTPLPRPAAWVAATADLRSPPGVRDPAGPRVPSAAAPTALGSPAAGQAVLGSPLPGPIALGSPVAGQAVLGSPLAGQAVASTDGAVARAADHPPRHPAARIRPPAGPGPADESGDQPLVPAQRPGSTPPVPPGRPQPAPTDRARGGLRTGSGSGPRTGPRRVLVVIGALAAIAVGGFVRTEWAGGKDSQQVQAAPQAPAATATGKCVVTYSVRTQADDKFTAGLTVTNRAATAIRQWTLRFILPGDQNLAATRGGTLRQLGHDVTVSSRRVINANRTVVVDLAGDYRSANDAPVAFDLNGTVCDVYLSATPGAPPRQVKTLPNGAVALAAPVAPGVPVPGLTTGPGGRLVPVGPDQPSVAETTSAAGAPSSGTSSSPTGSVGTTTATPTTTSTTSGSPSGSPSPLNGSPSPRPPEPPPPPPSSDESSAPTEPSGSPSEPSSDVPPPLDEAPLEREPSRGQSSS